MKKDLTNFLDEVVDIVNENDEVIGQVTRDELFSNQTLSHRSVRVLIFDKDKKILFQKRSLKKKNMPGIWTLTAAGHVKSGADIFESAAEELYEEVGLKSPLKFIRKRQEEFGERKVWVYTFMGEYDGGPVKLNENETEETRFLNSNGILEMQKQGQKFLQNALVNAREFWEAKF